MQQQSSSADPVWIEWATRNLASGVPEAKVVDALSVGGLDKRRSRLLVAAIKRDPMYRAAQRLAAEVRKWTSLAEATLDLHQQVHDFSRIPRVSDISAEEFLRDYYSRNLPVIIEGLAADWPALGKWTLPFFADHFGDEIVTYQTGRGSGDHRHSFIDHGRSGPFREYLDLIAQDDASNDYYLIAHDRLLDRPGFAPLFDDIIFDERFFDPVAPVGRVFFWLGPKGAMTPLHRDLGNVYLFQIAGKKEITMIPSLHMHKVYNETGYHCDVDLEDFDPDAYPLLKNALIAKEVIDEGDMLFIPVGWWHHVKAISRCITITGNNFRFPNTFTSIF